MSTRLKYPIINIQRKSKPKSFPVTLGEVKSFLRIENDQVAYGKVSSKANVASFI